MEDSNLDITMAEPDQTSSLLNHNVSFNSGMDFSLAAENDEQSLRLSFSLTDEERKMLKQQHNGIKNSNHSRTVLKDLSMNIENESARLQLSEDKCQSSLDDSTLEEDSQRIIDVDDTIELDQTTAAGNITTNFCFENQLLEVGRRCWPSSGKMQNYTKGCFWSPDGTCLLVPVHQDGMHVIELPLDLYTVSELESDRNLSALQSAVHVPEGGTVYDCVWYPLMSSQQPETCCWLATRQHEPIHMWDAFDGKLRCSYSGYDEVDEVVAAISLAFSHDGEKIFAGYKKSIKIFDTNRPGRIYDDYPVKRAISCMAQTTEQPRTLTCGNWHGFIEHFDLRCSPKQGPLFTLGGHSAGITQLHYNCDGNGGSHWQLFSGARKCSKLLLWDMRNYTKPLREFTRNVETNQRILFDLKTVEQQSWLASGDTKGQLRLWDLKEQEELGLELPLHEDCCNGVSFHPSLPILASTSGQYHFFGAEAFQNGSTLDSTLTATEAEPLPSEEQTRVVDYENAVLLLWHGKCKT
ncbi:telomerase Cajal body protein 1 homolog [Scaptodrosophila lebanonensis]|uniref:WD repeat-containing protein 79 n=1 Tax=Drosophila lebanonensis TaxID=7225 RepID=A0A6J2TLP1_DROLE|nr:telomerase Cajal body protein 1 homolog [Scaptodrosophila lebanonensis]